MATVEIDPCRQLVCVTGSQAAELLQPVGTALDDVSTHTDVLVEPGRPALTGASRAARVGGWEEALSAITCSGLVRGRPGPSRRAMIASSGGGRGGLSPAWGERDRHR